MRSDPLLKAIVESYGESHATELLSSGRLRRRYEGLLKIMDQASAVRVVLNRSGIMPEGWSKSL